MNDHMKGGHEQVGRYKASHKSNSHYSLTRDSHWNITTLTMFTLLYDYLRYSMLSYIIVISLTIFFIGFCSYTLSKWCMFNITKPYIRVVMKVQHTYKKTSNHPKRLKTNEEELNSAYMITRSKNKYPRRES